MEPVSPDLYNLALVLLLNDLNWTGFMRMPVAQQLALAASGHLSAEALVAATVQLGLIIRARRDAELLRMPSGGHGAH